MTEHRIVFAGQPISTQALPGDRLVIELESTPATGFRWTLDPHAGSSLTLIHSDYAAGAPAAVGAAGAQSFVFEARAPGQETLNFRYWRSWEGEASARRQWAVTVEVLQPSD